MPATRSARQECGFSNKPCKIVSWNIRQGGGTRAEAIANAVVREQADVVVLSEFRNNDAGALIRIKLLVSGFRHQFVSGDSGTQNGVLIASKALGSFTSFANQIADFPQAIIRFETARWDLYGMYLPHKKKHSLFPFLIHQLETRSRPSILVGDFNTGINGIDQKGSSFWYSEYLEQLAQKGYTDAFRHCHGDAREYSWFSNNGNGYRYDHSWVSDDVVSNVVSCNFDHAVREEGLSDHALMTLVLAPELSSQT